MKQRTRRLCALLLCAVFSLSQTMVVGAAGLSNEEPAEISAELPDGEAAESSDEPSDEEAAVVTADAQEDAVITESADDAAAEDETTITIFSTNDIHGNVAQTDGHIGLDQVAGIAESTENSLLLDAGDATQGISFASINSGMSVIRVMNSAGYDAMALGNHEFDYGPDTLAKNAEAAAFPILSANARVTGTKCHEILEAAGKRIAVIGLTTTATKPSKFPSLTIEDELTAAKREIAEVKDQSDAIILLCHMGDSDKAVDCTSRKLLEGLTTEELSEVTAVVDGHSHTVEETAYENIPIVQAQTQLSNMGQITLHFKGEDVTAEGHVLDYTEATNYPLTESGEEAKDRVDSIVLKEAEEQTAILGETIGENDTMLWGGYIYWDYAEPRIVETNYGDFVCDAFHDAAADWLESKGIPTTGVVALENGGGIGAALPNGEVNRGDILSAFSHGNSVQLLKITPADLYAALETGLLTITGQDETGLLIRGKESGSFMQCSGFTYAYDPAGEAGSKVTRVVLPNPIGAIDRADTTTTLYVATNDYVAAELPNAELVAELGGEDMVVESFLRDRIAHQGMGAYSSASAFGRITIENDKSPETYEAELPVMCIDDLKTVPAGHKIRVTINGGEPVETIVQKGGVVRLTLGKGDNTIMPVGGGTPVYVNNYSGSGIKTTRAGYYSNNLLLDHDTIVSYPHSAELSKSELVSGFRAAWSGSKLKVSWGEVCGADGYDIFVEKCGSTLNDKDLTKSVKAGTTSVSLTKEGTKALTGTKSYKCRVKAYQLGEDGAKEYIASTFIGHLAARKSKTRTNAKSVTPNKQRVELAGTGDTASLTAKITRVKSSKKLLDKNHGAQIHYQTSDSSVAVVSNNGTVTATGAGTCLVYVSAANGVNSCVVVHAGN